MLVIKFNFLNVKALLKMGIRGVTVSDVKGFGAQGGSKERQGGKSTADYKYLNTKHVSPYMSAVHLFIPKLFIRVVRLK